MEAHAVNSPKVLAIGLDATDLVYIRQNLHALPVLSRLFESGPIRELAAEPLSGSVWPTFATGTGYGDHGIYQHVQWDPARMSVRRVDADWLAIEPFWRTLEKRRVIALDVPYVFRSPSTEALEVANWGCHDLMGPYWSNDAELQRAILRDFGPHPMGYEIPVEKTRPQLERMAARLLDGVRRKTALACRIMRERRWDVFITVFGETHRGGHLLWPDTATGDDPVPQGALLDLYCEVDRGLGAILATAGSETDVVIFSLHGMDVNTSQSHISDWFIERAAALYKGSPVSREVYTQPTSGIIRRLRAAVPASLQHAIGLSVPVGVRDWVVAREISGGRDWRKTLAVNLRGDVGGYFQFNVKGREAKGCLDPQDLPRWRAFLKEQLFTLQDGEGNPLVNGVRFPTIEEKGPRAGYLPDLLVLWNEGLRPASHVSSPLLGTAKLKLGTGRGGNHRFRGFYIHRGPRASEGAIPIAKHIKELGGVIKALSR